MVESRWRWDDGRQPGVAILGGVLALKAHVLFGIISVVKRSGLDINTQQAMDYGCL